MKALTVHQPHASLIAIGAKCYETRSWLAPKTLKPGDLLAIHAAKRECHAGFAAMGEIARTAAHLALMRGGLTVPLRTMGCVLAVCEFLACHETRRQYMASGQELLFGNWTSGRYAWELRLVYRLPEPIPARGRQGLWQWEPPAEVVEYLRSVGAA